MPVAGVADWHSRLSRAHSAGGVNYCVPGAGQDAKPVILFLPALMIPDGSP